MTREEELEKAGFKLMQEFGDYERKKGEVIDGHEFLEYWNPQAKVVETEVIHEFARVLFNRRVRLTVKGKRYLREIG